MTRTRGSLLVAAVLGALLLGGCGSGSTSSPDQAAATSSESSPLGDIPDDQVYVPYGRPTAPSP